MFSKRVESMSPSPIRKFAPMSEMAKKKGKQVIPLNIGQPDLLTPVAYFEALSNISEKIIAYAPSEGIPQLREAFSRYFGSKSIPYGPDEILVTNGASEALLFVFAALCDAGDEVLAFEPFYSNYQSISHVVGVNIAPVKTDPKINYRIPPYEEIKSKITSRTKAIIVTNPSNPTGIVLTKEEMAAITKAAVEADLFIIADEVYREFIYDGTTHYSFAEDQSILDRLVIVDSVSKRFSACGARIGCIASKNAELMAHLLKLCQSRLSVPTAEQIASVALLDLGEEAIEEARKEYSARRDVCAQILSKSDLIKFSNPQGAFYFILSLPIEDADDFTGWLLSDFELDGETIMLCPADGCYITEGGGKNEVRISYCIAQDKLERGMRILDEGLKAYSALERKKALV